MAQTYQYSAVVTPDNATNKSVTWSVDNGTGAATIDTNGVLTPTSLGTVTVKATAVDGSGVVGSKTVTIVAPDVLVTAITIEGPERVTFEETSPA